MLSIIRKVFAVTTILFLAMPVLANSHKCADLSKSKLEIDEYHLVLNVKKPFCTRVPGTVRLPIENKPNADHQIQAGDVTVAQKANSPLTITGSNSANRLELIISVTGVANVNEEADFLITVKDVGMLDPKVRVIDTDALLRLLAQAIREALDTLGLNWDDVARVVEMQREYTD